MVGIIEMLLCKFNGYQRGELGGATSKVVKTGGYVGLIPSAAAGISMVRDI
jgi:hypothetical protein